MWARYLEAFWFVLAVVVLWVGGVWLLRKMNPF